MPKAATTAAESFAAALATLRAHSIEPDDRPPPIAYAVPARTAGCPLEASLASVEGPLEAALASQRAGEVSSFELIEAALSAIEASDGALGAMVEVHPDVARADARAADTDRDAGRWRGPLHGVPVTVKDVIDVAGYTTRAGSLAYCRRPTIDAAAVARLRRAGAVIVGKASTHEFALGVTTPQSRNPFDHDRIPGGSSGGSAISVATGMALASLGTDTRASIRVPAALCGVVGVKATHGTVPIAGSVTLSWTMDHVAPMAATVGDVAIVLGALTGAGAGSHDRPLLPGAGWRIGVVEATLDGADPGIASLVYAAVEAMVHHAGAQLVPLDAPDGHDLDVAGAAGLVVSRCEAAAAHRSLGLDRFLYSAEVAEQLDAADVVTATDYLDAQRARGQLAENLLGCFERADVLAMPTTLTVAPPVADHERYLMTLARNAIPWSFVGFPAMSVPVGLVRGLPVGLQLVAPPHREDVLLAAGRAVEGVVGTPLRPRH